MQIKEKYRGIAGTCGNPFYACVYNQAMSSPLMRPTHWAPYKQKDQGLHTSRRPLPTSNPARTSTRLTCVRPTGTRFSLIAAKPKGGSVLSTLALACVQETVKPGYCAFSFFSIATPLWLPELSCNDFS